MARRIALISDHASPLAVLAGDDSGGQNVHVAQLARALAARGHEVDVFTRRYRSGQPRVVEWSRNVLIDNGNETEWLRSPLREPCHVARNLRDAAAHILSAAPARETGRARVLAS